MNAFRSTHFVLCATALAACGKSANGNSAAVTSDSISAATAGSLEGPRHMGRMMDSVNMPGMETMMGSRMTDSMQTHMRDMGAMSPDRMRAMVPMHRQIVANMLSSFDDSMQRMNMPSDAAWIALRDSIRQDLIHMPDLNASQLRTSITQHHERVMRLMQMHHKMMNSMKK